MKPTDEQREMAYTQVSQSQRYLYTHPTSGRELKLIAQKYDLTEPDTYRAFAILVGDVILGFYQPAELPNLFMQELKLSPQMAGLASADVMKFLSPLSDPNWQPPVSPTASSEESPVTTISEEIAATEAALNSIPPLRTMTSDRQEEETVYSTTQSAILREGETQNQTEETEARWDTGR